MHLFPHGAKLVSIISGHSTQESLQGRLAAGLLSQRESDGQREAPQSNPQGGIVHQASEEERGLSPTFPGPLHSPCHVLEH